MTYRVDILNPKADKLLQNLADLKLISISKTDKNESFLKIVNKIRKKSASNPISFDAITKEVEIVRSKRYASKKKA